METVTVPGTSRKTVIIKDASKLTKELRGIREELAKHPDTEEIDPDEVEAVVSDGVVKLEFGDGRRAWVVSTQRAARQIWLAADQRAWHFAYVDGEGDQTKWVADKTGDELFATLTGLLKQTAGLELEF